MTDLYFGGAEVPSWRKVLREEEVSHVSLSFMGLRRRVKFSQPWIIAEKFEPHQHIFLDSGAYTVNRAGEEKYTLDDLREIAAQYMAFVEQNIDGIDFASEFDALALGQEWIEAQRRDFWSLLPPEKFMPVWHEEQGLSELERLCQQYPRVGVTQVALGERSLVPTLNNLVRDYGTRLHGVAMTKTDMIEAVDWASVASLSWISPGQYGDTIIWTGRELKRYPKKMKDQARKRHRTYLTEQGFDAEAIAADDSAEVIRLSLWSWQQFMRSLKRNVSVPSDVDPVTAAELALFGDIAEDGPSRVDGTPSEKRKSSPTPVRIREANKVFPTMGIATLTERAADGTETTSDLVKVSSVTLRACNNCFLSAKCPAFEPDASCAFKMPVEIKTKDQLMAVQNSLIEMQTQRVMFARAAEELEGGYPDPNLSQEIDRLQKIVAKKVELESDSFSVKFEASGRGNPAGGAGIMSRLFGPAAGEQARSLPAPIPSDDVIVGQAL